MPSALACPSPASANDLLTVFAGFNRIANGRRSDVVAKLRTASLAPDTPLLVFDDATGAPLDLDLRVPTDPAGPPAANPTEATEAPLRGVGRPRLGVVAREVTLLPRHWDWLNRQPGGASVALRRLVEEARRVHQGRDTVRESREATYRFMTAIAGGLAGFEEAARALFAGDRTRFKMLVEPWPEDVRVHLAELSSAAWSGA
ncbi:MAG: hypothetical protein JWQ03_2890 [Variovorax sp.]|nr:hypothetical protein [Variovorax sp.]